MLLRVFIFNATETHQEDYHTVYANLDNNLVTHPPNIGSGGGGWVVGLLGGVGGCVFVRVCVWG